jgi:hypothetical protein
MTSRHKDFGSEAVPSEPISFTVNGETFTAVPAIQGAFLLHFVNQAGATDGVHAAEAIMEFYSRVLLPESLERFNAMCSSTDKIVSMTTLSEIVGWLVEEYTKRPTQGSSSSSTGLSTGGPTSTQLPFAPAPIPGA